MLILTRRVGEAVVIDEEVTVTVLGVKGNQVRIGVNAPKNVSVHREEIFERIKNERKSSDQPYVGDQRSGRRELIFRLRLPTAFARRATVGPRESACHCQALSFLGPTAARLSALPPPGPAVIIPRLPEGRNGELAEWSKAHPC